MAISQRSTSCRRCGAARSQLIRLTTRASNRNGNAGRPYLKCGSCKCFITFDDDRGYLIPPFKRQEGVIDLKASIQPNHPHCDCGKPSRQQVENLEKGRKMHVKCSTGKCGFWARIVHPNGEDLVCSEAMLDAMMKELAI
jgi:hypothetical protein